MAMFGGNQPMGGSPGNSFSTDSQPAGGMGAPSPGNAPSYGYNAMQGQQGVQQAQQALWKAQERCAQGDGANCQLAQRLQQQLAQMQQQHQGQIGMVGMPRGAGSMGQNRGGGGGGINPNNYQAMMLQNMYGTGFGGGGMG